MFKSLLSGILLAGTLLVVALLGLTGCTTNLNKPDNTPEGHCLSASRYLRLVENNTNTRSSYEYRLRAADHYLKANRVSDASKVLRDIQKHEPDLDLTTRNQLLEARLSLLKQEEHRANTLIESLLAPYANSLPLGEGSNGGVGSIGSGGVGDGLSNQKIALLLPTKGPHAKASKTIREGFLAAYYKNAQDKNLEPSIQVYDTGEGKEVEAAYQKALADNANFIVGPLTKSEVQTLAGLKLDIPVLALNTLPGSNLKGKIYQFGLMPEDEIAAVVQMARADGHRTALIIAPKSEWGERMANNFSVLWNASQRGKSTLLLLSRETSIDEQIEAAVKQLGGARNKSKNQNQGTEASNRKSGAGGGFDMVFLAASPELARQVKPLIQHYYDPQLAVYATSSVYSGKPSPKVDQDLNGICFFDMPSVIQQATPLNVGEEIKDDIKDTAVDAARDTLKGGIISKQAFSQSAQQDTPRYFAMGVDAYYLATQLASGNSLPSGGTAGMTGVLRLEGQRVQRELMRARFENGIPIPY